MRVYKYYNAKWGLEAISRKRLKVSTIAETNDPFEFRALYSDTHHGTTNLQRWRSEENLRHGFISFSRTRTNPVLWAHYADNHKGMCLEFEVDDSLIQPVEYKRSRLDLDDLEVRKRLASDRWEDKLFQFTTKFSFWRYEQEYRAFQDIADPRTTMENGIYFEPFGEIFSLKRVFLGWNYDQTKCARKLSTIKDIGSVKIDYVRPSLKSFHMIIDRNPRFKSPI